MSRTMLIAAGAILFVSVCLVGTCGIAGFALFANQPNVVGKWEPESKALGLGSIAFEFNDDGTGAIHMVPLFLDKADRIDFKWHTEGLRKNVLVIDTTGSKFVKDTERKVGLSGIGGKQVSYFTREGDLLTIKPAEHQDGVAVPTLFLKRIEVIDLKGVNVGPPRRK